MEKQRTKTVAKHYSLLECPSCATLVSEDDINIKKTIAKCSNCGVVFNFEEQVETPVIHRQEKQKPEVFLPEGIEVLELRESLDIELSWGKRWYENIFLLFFTVVWNLFIGVFVFMAFFSGGVGMLPFMSIHILVGIGLIYYQLATFLNTTYITANRHHIHIEHKPIRVPFFGSKLIEVTEINQLFVHKYVKSTSKNGTRSYSHAVKMMLNSGRVEQLIKGIDYYDQARFIEQELERFLGIQDRKVSEEYDPEVGRGW